MILKAFVQTIAKISLLIINFSQRPFIIGVSVVVKHFEPVNDDIVIENLSKRVEFLFVLIITKCHSLNQIFTNIAM